MKKPKRVSRHLSSSLLVSLPLLACTVPAMAQVVPGAGGPQMGDSNGVPLVNINAPNAKGISHNRYDQFNVGKEGLIFNNVTKHGVRSELSGAEIPINPGGWAGIILNEVTGTSPSQLLGKMEVAGERAGVVIANPNGITCDGCGFINAPQATLTTGVSQFNDDRTLKGYAVTRGDINITGKGFVGGSRLDLIARALKINAGVSAYQVFATTGAALVDDKGVPLQELAGEGERPQVGIDVSALGGMYASSIRLLSSEKGVGVANAGEIIASAGELKIDSAGNLRSSGTIRAEQDRLTLAAAGDVHADGTQFGGGAKRGAGGITINAGGLAKLGGTTATTKVTGLKMNAQDIDLQGTSTVGSTLVLNGRSNVNVTGSHSAGASEVSAGNDLHIGGSLTSLDSTSLVAGRNLKLDGSQNAWHIFLTAGKDLEMNADSTVAAASGLGLQAENAHLKGTVRVGSLDANVGKWLTNEGVVAVERVLDVTATNIRNSGSLVNHNDKPVVSKITTKYTLDNRGGTIHSERGSLHLKVAALENGEGGRVMTPGALRIDASGAVRNTGGSIDAGGRIDMNTWLLDNTGGLLTGGSTVNIDSIRTLRNRDGKINSDSAILMKSGGMLDNRDGEILAKGALEIRTAGVDNRDGLLQSRADLLIEGEGNLFNQRGSVLAAKTALIQLGNSNTVDNRGGGISGENIGLSAGTLNNEQGADNEEKGIFAQNNLTLNLAKLVGDGRIYGWKSLVLNMRGDYHHTVARLQSDESVKVQVAGTLTNGGTLSSAKSLSIGAKRVDNRGDIAGKNVVVNATEDVVNTGSITGEDLLLSAKRIRNGAEGDPATGATIAATKALTLSAGHVVNRNAVVSSGGNLRIVGDWQTGANARRVENLNGEIKAGGERVIKADEFIDQPRTPKLTQAVNLQGQPAGDVVAALSPSCDKGTASASGASGQCMPALQ